MLTLENNQLKEEAQSVFRNPLVMLPLGILLGFGAAKVIR
jgi:hypothetical protein